MLFVSQGHILKYIISYHYKILSIPQYFRNLLLILKFCKQICTIRFYQLLLTSCFSPFLSELSNFKKLPEFALPYPIPHMFRTYRQVKTKKFGLYSIDTLYIIIFFYQILLSFSLSTNIQFWSLFMSQPSLFG